MAPGIDGLPAAERDVDVSGPVAEFLTSVSPRAAVAAEARPARLRVAAVPLALQPPGPGRPGGLPARGWRARASRLHHDLLLMAKLFSTLGYAVTPEVAGADRVRDRLRAGRRHRCPSRPARSATPSRPARARNATWSIVGSGAGGAVAAATLAEAGLDVIVLEAGAHYDRDSYPERPPRGDRRALPRRRPDDRRRAAADPGAGGEGRRRHHGDQLRHLLPRPRSGARGLEAALRHRAGPSDLDADFAEAEDFLRVTQLDPERMGRNGQLAMEGAAAIGASGSADLPQRRQLRAVQLLPLRLRDRRQARHARQLPPPRRRRRGAGPRRGRGEPDPGRGRPRRRRRLRGRAATGGGRVLRGAGEAGGDRRRRRPRHAGAAAALRPRRPPGRPQPPHPPRLLGRRPLRGGGARLGRGDAELLRRRVGAPAGPARGDLHAAGLRRRLAARRRPRPPASDARLRPRRLDRRPPLRPLLRPGRARLPRARCAPPTS